MRHSLILPIWWHFSLVNNKYIRFIRNVIKFENKENRIPTARKLKFSIRISSVNVTKSARYCGFGHIYWRNLHFLCSAPPPPPGTWQKWIVHKVFRRYPCLLLFILCTFNLRHVPKEPRQLTLLCCFCYQCWIHWAY